MGDDLRSQCLVFVMFIKLIIGGELCALKTLELKFWLKFINVQNFLIKSLLESFLIYSFMCSGFLKRPVMPWHVHS